MPRTDGGCPPLPRVSLGPNFDPVMMFGAPPLSACSLSVGGSDAMMTGVEIWSATAMVISDQQRAKHGHSGALTRDNTWNGSLKPGSGPVDRSRPMSPPPT